MGLPPGVLDGYSLTFQTSDGLVGVTRVMISADHRSAQSIPKKSVSGLRC